MLTSQDFKEIEKEASKLYGDLEFEIIQEIAERIANFGYANTVALNNIQLAQEMGLVYEDIISLVSKYSELSESQIKEIFETDEGARYVGEFSLGFNPMIKTPMGDILYEFEKSHTKRDKQYLEMLFSISTKLNINSEFYRTKFDRILLEQME